MPSLPRLIVACGPVAWFVLAPLTWLCCWWEPSRAWIERLLEEIEAEATKLEPPYEGQHARLPRE